MNTYVIKSESEIVFSKEALLSQVEFDTLLKRNDELLKKISELEKQIPDTDNPELEAANERIEELEKFEPNYTFEGIGKIFIRCDNLADQNVIESLPFKRL